MRVALIQATPAFMDLDAGLDRIRTWLGRAAAEGAALAVFPETFLPGYPLWCDGSTVARFRHPASQAAHRHLVEASLRVPSPAFSALQDIIREAGMAVTLGVSERSVQGDTLWNSLLTFDGEGRLLNHHRKLVPTHGERLLWAPGDAAGLQVQAVAGVQLGGLICWEHWMPLPRFALHAQGEQVHVAAWPHGGDLHQLASRHYAVEGACFVLAACSVMRHGDLPPDFPLREELLTFPDPLIPGGSAIYGPAGERLAGPLGPEEGLLVADLDINKATEARQLLDTGGHYHRPELFSLGVRRERAAPVAFE